jgi:hypothetical protein
MGGCAHVVDTRYESRTGNEAERWLSGKKRDALAGGLSIILLLTNVVMWRMALPACSI